MAKDLTHREVQILKLMTDGLTNKEIAGNLSISEATVENHIHHIYVKLGISNRVQAIVYSLRSGTDLLKDTAENEGNPS